MLQLPELLENSSVEITAFFNLVLVFNRGVSFGMFASHNQPLLLIVLSIAIISILVVWLWRDSTLANACGVGFVIGGATGNIADRVYYGAVVDFLDFHVNGLHWPAFNIADSFVFIGVVVLCIYSMFSKEKNNP